MLPPLARAPRQTLATEMQLIPAMKPAPQANRTRQLLQVLLYYPVRSVALPERCEPDAEHQDERPWQANVLCRRASKVNA